MTLDIEIFKETNKAKRVMSNLFVELIWHRLWCYFLLQVFFGHE